MSIDVETFRAHAREFSDAFERATRTDGTAFVKLSSDAPEWMTDAVRDSHARALPDDYVYSLCEECADGIAEHSDWLDDVDSVEDYLHEIADAAVPIYNAERARWLSENISNCEWIAESVANFGAPSECDVFDLLGQGMYAQASYVAGILFNAIREAAE